MANISDVAALAKVSKATASRVFSRPEIVSAETARQVMEAAEKLGFVPNHAARTLAGGRTGLVAMVVPTLTNSFFTPIIAGAQAVLERAGLQMTVVVRPLDSTTELFAMEKLSRQVDGFIMVAPLGSDDLVRTVAALKPTMLVDREIADLASVTADTGSAFGAIAAHLIDVGHKNLVYVGGPSERSWQDAQRTRAVREAAERSGVALEVIGPFPPTFAAGVRAAEVIRDIAPTAVLPFATALGLGIQHAYLARSMVCPVISSVREIVEALGLRQTPAVDVDGLELGRVAASGLTAQIRNQPSSTFTKRLAVRVDFGA